MIYLSADQVSKIRSFLIQKIVSKKVVLQYIIKKVMLIRDTIEKILNSFKQLILNRYP